MPGLECDHVISILAGVKSSSLMSSVREIIKLVIHMGCLRRERIELIFQKAEYGHGKVACPVVVGYPSSRDLL
jgi:hypothetical protein